MKPSINAKVVLKQSVLHGSNQSGAMQIVAYVYLDGKEFRAWAPPEASGAALEWIPHISVRQLTESGGESEVVGEARAFVVEAVNSELVRQKRDANRPLGMNPDGLHCDAQICLKGHVQSSDGTPFDPKAHCKKCGSPCIDECTHCQEPIQGAEKYRPASFSRPRFCHRCGKPYPWTEDALRTARELLAHDDKLSPDERNQILDDMEYIISDPKGDLVATKKKLLDFKLEKVKAPIREAVLDFMAKLAVELVKSGGQ